jgi:non-specific serine/threonine protein kinase
MRDSGNLPAEVTNLVGRATEVRTVRSLLGQSRLVTITGAGGLGKTRVALQVAREAERAFPGGVWLIELAALRDPNLVEPTVASVLGEGEGRPTHGELARRIRNWRALLVFDNCEHLVGACAELAGSLLRLAQDVRILATSRENLRVAGEQVLRLDPLAIPDKDTPAEGLLTYDSVQLLADRARAVDLDFAVTEANASDVARLCRSLEGVPLAIELAAGRLHTLSVGQIADRLTDPYRILTQAPRDAPPRHGSLENTITWSYRLCSPAEQRLWARMSVFAGPVDTAAVEAVCAKPGLTDDPAEVLDGLVRKSVIIRDHSDPPRFRLLDAIRHHGRRSLDPDLDADLENRHADYYEQLSLEASTGWFSSRQLAHADRLRQATPDLRVALDHVVHGPDPERALRLATRLFPLWLCLGRPREGDLWLGRALAAAGPATPVRADALWVHGWIQLIIGQIEDARSTLSESKALAEELDQPGARDYARMLLAMTDAFQGRLPGAIAQYRDVVQSRRVAGDNPAVGVMLFLLAEMCWANGELDNALHFSAQAEKICGELGEQWGRSYALWVRAMALSSRGDHDEAAETARRCLEMKVSLGDIAGILLACEVLSWTMAAVGCWSDAALLHCAIQPRWETVCQPLMGLGGLVSRRNLCAAQLREHLGETRYGRIHTAGLTMSLEEITRLALRAAGTDSADDAPKPRRTRGPLTPRETEVAALLAEGMSNRAIASTLVVSPRTAEVHVERILTKLGLSRRAQVAAWWHDTDT